jgi:hypothetical protein
MAVGHTLDLELLPNFAALPEFVETAPTFAENSAGKALYYSRHWMARLGFFPPAARELARATRKEMRSCCANCAARLALNVPRVSFALLRLRCAAVPAWSFLVR